MKALQDRCVANEGVIRRFRKRQEIEKKEEQYKEVVRTLNKKLTATFTKLKEESRLKEEVEKAKTNLTMELVVLHKQMDKAKADVMAEFCVSHPSLMHAAFTMVTGSMIA